MEDHNEETFEFSFDINGIRAMRSAIDYLIQVWPGAPARPTEEQEFLWHMRDQLAKCQMEHSFHNLSADR